MATETQARPTATHNTFTQRTGRFDLLHPDKEDALYTFRLRADAPAALTRNLYLSTDYDPGFSPDHHTAVEAVEGICETYRLRYLYNGGLAKGEALLAYLRTVEEQDALDAARHAVALAEWRVADATRALDKARATLALLEAEVTP